MFSVRAERSWWAPGGWLVQGVGGGWRAGLRARGIGSAGRRPAGAGHLPAVLAAAGERRRGAHGGTTGQTRTTQTGLAMGRIVHTACTWAEGSSVFRRNRTVPVAGGEPARCPPRVHAPCRPDAVAAALGCSPGVAADRAFIPPYDPISDLLAGRSAPAPWFRIWEEAKTPLTRRRDPAGFLPAARPSLTCRSP